LKKVCSFADLNLGKNAKRRKEEKFVQTKYFFWLFLDAPFWDGGGRGDRNRVRSKLFKYKNDWNLGDLHSKINLSQFIIFLIPSNSQ
jgi:hypothetical protein